mgnify:CR=1 FL=1
MITVNNRWNLGQKLLERARPFLPSQAVRRRPLPRKAPPDPDIAHADEYAVLSQEKTISLSLADIVQSHSPFPAYTAIMGVCDDGLPFLLDLSNPAPGSLLVVGDPQAGMAAFIKATLASAALLNAPDQVSFSLIVHEPGDFLYLSQADHCQELLTPTHSAADSFIESLVETAEQRRREARSGPALILAIDNLAACLQAFNQETFTRLYWLVRHGPRYRLWTLAGLSTEDIKCVEPHLLAAFRTRILGSTRPSRQMERLIGTRVEELPSLEPGAQFCTSYAGDWIRFWICEIS